MSNRSRTARLPEPLASALSSELARLGGAERAGTDLVEILARWPAAVGETIARNAWPARLARTGTLVVHASSSTWAFELTQLEDRIRQCLGTVAPARLEFVVGPVPAPGPERAPPERVLPPLPLSAADRLGAEEIAARIEDPGLRRAAARAAAAALAHHRRGGRPDRRA